MYRKALGRVVRTAQKITGATLPTTGELAEKHCLSRTQGISGNSTRRFNNSFPSSHQENATSAKTDRFMNSFYLTDKIAEYKMKGTRATQYVQYRTCKDFSLHAKFMLDFNVIVHILFYIWVVLSAFLESILYF